MSYNPIELSRMLKLSAIQVTEVENLYSETTKELHGRAFKSEFKIPSKNPDEKIYCKFTGVAIEMEGSSTNMNCQVKYNCHQLGVKGELRFIIPNEFKVQGVANYAKAITAKSLLQEGLVRELREASYKIKK